MNKETAQKLAEVLGLEVYKDKFGMTVKFSNDDRKALMDIGRYFTLERMIRLAIEYRIDMEWCYDLHEVAAVRHKPFDRVTSGIVKFNGSKEDAERALKEAIALAVIAIKESELGGVTSEDV